MFYHLNNQKSSELNSLIYSDYSLGMEALDQLYFMNQAVRVCHADHNDSILSWIAYAH